MSDDKIIVKGAQEHNLKNVSFEFPKNKIVVFTGVSGSGKSSMAFDTLFAEGQRRYVESLSSYARQFLGGLNRPKVDSIEGLSPAIAINQKAISHNPRSTVGTITEIYDYLRLLFARIGHPKCPKCGREVSSQTPKQIVTQILTEVEVNIGIEFSFRFMIMAPLIRNKAGDFRGLMGNLKSQGFKNVKVDNEIVDLYGDFAIAKTNKHNIDVIIDKISLDKKSLKNNYQQNYERLIEDVEQGLDLGNGTVICMQVMDKDIKFVGKIEKSREILYSENLACPVCNVSIPNLEPHLFSFNSPQGACEECKGIGLKMSIDRSRFSEWKARMLEARYKTTQSETIREELERFMVKSNCEKCGGARLNKNGLSVYVRSKNIYDLCQLSVENLNKFIQELDKNLDSEKEKEIAKSIIKEIGNRLEFLLSVGLEYLSLSRNASSLSSGESQRIRLASQIGTGLTGVLYILDEPTIGLHSRDNDRLITTLKRLKELGNSLVVVEHDKDVIESSDYIVDFGLLAGKNGGEVVYGGSLEGVKKDKASLTGKYMSGKMEVASIATNGFKFMENNCVELSGCRQWNLKNITAKIPLNCLTVVTGVSGSGKSTLVHDVLCQALKEKIYGKSDRPASNYKDIKNWQNIKDYQMVDQSPVGRTSRSNPATYTKIFDDIRKLMSETTEAQIKGYRPGHFSFNIKGGRCPACEGQGENKIEMQFLPDIYVTCEHCHGKRYKDEILEVYYKEKNIAEILEMTIAEAFEFFKNMPSIRRKLETLVEVGLDYLRLGQNSNTLSGGESQRLKISRELVKYGKQNTLYIMDEPTTGLHFHDIDRFVKVIKKLIDKGNSVVLIEHNMDIIKNADWIIDMGPEGGDRGGEIVVQGTVEDVKNCQKSYTGKYLRKIIGE